MHRRLLHAATKPCLAAATPRVCLALAPHCPTATSAPICRLIGIGSSYGDSYRMASSHAAFSSGTDVSLTQPQLDALVAGSWTLRSDGMALERSFKFKTFKAAWSFMDSVAAECKKQKHHPEWSNVYNRVFVRWTTHSSPGLSSKDVFMARVCDEIAQRDESRAIEDADDTSALRDVADTVAVDAADCCNPKSRESKVKESIEKVEKEEGAQGSVAGVGGQPS